MIQNIDDFVRIRPFGGIVIFDSILCDGENKRLEPINICCYTHIHEDHLKGLEDALSTPDTIVLTTKLTKQLVSAREGEGFVKLKNKFLDLDYKKIKKIDDYEISFRIANHILGSGQLLVRGKEGSVLYSSDFMLKGTDTDIPDVDVLVLDANHGSESITQDFLSPSEAKRDLKEILEREISNKKRQVNIRAHVGTLQKIMSWCDEICPKRTPFFSDPREKRTAGVFRKNFADIREIKSDKENEFYEISQFEQPYVHFLRLNAPKELCEIQDPMVTTIHFSDVRYSYDKTEEYSRKSGINLKEHASHSEILDYVKKINPKFVVVDNGPPRLNTPKNAIDLSEAIRKKIGLPSIFLPKKRPGE